MDYIAAPSMNLERCEHAEYHFVKFVTSHGVTRYSYECNLCERSIGVIIKGSLIKDRDKVPNRTEDRTKKVIDYKSYKEYLLSDKWKEKRLSILNRDNRICQRCSCKSNRLVVHHLTYKNLTNEKPEELVTLCEDCHSIIHLYANKYNVLYVPNRIDLDSLNKMRENRIQDLIERGNNYKNYNKHLKCIAGFQFSCDNELKSRISKIVSNSVLYDPMSDVNQTFMIGYLQAVRKMGKKSEFDNQIVDYFYVTDNYFEPEIRRVMAHLKSGQDLMFFEIDTTKKYETPYQKHTFGVWSY